VCYLGSLANVLQSLNSYTGEIVLLS